MPPVPSQPESLRIRAVGPDELDLLARVRGRCYDSTYARAKRHHENLGSPYRWGDLQKGDFLVAERGGRPVGTITSLQGLMSIRGVTMPCQGIAWVGTTHDARRSSGRGPGSEPGIATQLMHRTLAMARERGEVLTALVPFRASFYEHFGYGLSERRALWTIPMSLLPGGYAGGFELLEPGDEALERAIADCRTRQMTRAHGDIAFPQYDHLGGFTRAIKGIVDDGYCFFRRSADGVVNAFVMTEPEGERGNRGLICDYVGYDTADDFLAILRFLGTLRDQYSNILIAAPVDEPINLLLRETQLPHRGVEFRYARCEISTRLQVRVLDHLRFFNDAPWPDPLVRGSLSVSVQECEGTASSFTLEVAAGRCQAKPAGGGVFSCPDKTWAAIAMGDLKASTAVAMGLAECQDQGAIDLLDSLTQGRLPFCREYF